MRKLGAALAVVLLAAMITTSALAGAPPVKQAKVDVDGLKFTPGTLKIKQGTKVVWKWVDGSDIQHNIYVMRGPAKFHSKTMAKGSFSHLFTKRGKYVLFCRIHPFMRETVTVK